jgi:hypothetical protein
MNSSIPLTQKLYLLAIHPEKGGLISASYSVMNIILIGALFLELFLNKNVSFDQKKVVLLNDKTTDPLHRFLIEKIKHKQDPLKISTWISKLHFSQKYIRSDVQKGLVERRIIKMEPHQFLFFKWQKSKIINKQPLFNLISDIESQIFRGTENEEEISSILKNLQKDLNFNIKLIFTFGTGIASMYPILFRRTLSSISIEKFPDVTRNLSCIVGLSSTLILLLYNISTDKTSENPPLL